MLSQIVSPLVDTQIRKLANSQATYSTLIKTIAKWLSYLGVKAKVNHLTHQSGQIKIALTVGKPNTCNTSDWQKILHNLDRQQSLPSIDSYNHKLLHKTTEPTVTKGQIAASQRSKLQRLFAYLIQISQIERQNNPQVLSTVLHELNLDELMILGIRSALKVPQSIDRLIKEIEPDIVALALPEAMKIVLATGKLNPESEIAILRLLKVAKSSTSNNTWKATQEVI